MTPNEKGSLRSLEEACAEVERELNVRKRCFDRWIQDGKMTRVDARDRLDRMAAALEYLQRSQALAEVADDCDGLAMHGEKPVSPELGTETKPF
jgi:hypothetical protein